MALTMTVRKFCDDSGLGKTKTYDLINSGALETVVVGRRRLIKIDSARQLLGVA